ncbi:MAG: DEAD/DEAH box helicase family protein [Candidatus Omnitrophica bacterium]|nr:DEAD/DEAH box helicase family protein [Candidatus Omnitrophota bacterium]
MIPHNVDWTKLCELLFGSTPYEYELKIFESVFSQKARKVSVRATTRAGKSFTMGQIAVAKATLLDNHPVGLIAPTFDKTRIIMDYVAQFLQNPLFEDLIMLNASGLTRLERLRKEVSKRRITFKNGSLIECKSVDLDNKGFGSMGHAYKTVIVDETDLIDDEAFGKIYRMLVESEDSQMIEIGNPWFLQHFYTHHHDPSWSKIHVRWQDCVRAGRMTLEAVEDQRRELTPLEFQVLFDADFPEEVENAVFPKDAILALKEPWTPEKPSLALIGVDVARGGRDRTVITEFVTQGDTAGYAGHEVMDSKDEMQVVGHVALKAESWRAKRVPVEIAVDAVGPGGGVKDRLTELGYNAKEFIAGEKARNVNRFSNLKTETAFLLADSAKKGFVRNLPPDSRYLLELRAYTFEVRSDKQMKLVDPSDKSPDYADSFLIGLSGFVYRDHASPRFQDAEWRPKWLRGRPTNLLKPK